MVTPGLFLIVGLIVWLDVAQARTTRSRIHCYKFTKFSTLLYSGAELKYMSGDRMIKKRHQMATKKLNNKDMQAINKGDRENHLLQNEII